MKKVFVTLLFCLLIVGITFSAAAKTTTLTFWTFQELHQQFLEKEVARWNENNPDNQIALEATVYPYDQMHNKLLIALQSGVGAPDIADIEISKFANYLKGNTPQLVAFNDVVDPLMGQMIKARFDNYSKNGNYYGIPYHVGATVMYYNTELTDQAGVDIDDIVTWDDYVAAGQKVKAATGKPMTTVEVTEHWSLYPLISQIGSDIFAEDGSIILDNEKNERVLTFLDDLVHKYDIAIPTPGGFHHSEEYWAFMNDEGAASLMMPLWYMGRFVQYMPDLKGKMAIRPLPVWEEGGNRSAGMGGTGTVVTIQSDHKDLAKDFLVEAKLSVEASHKLWTELGFDPVRWEVWDDPVMSESNQYTDYFKNEDIFGMLLDIKDEINPTMITEQYPQAIDLLKKNVSFKVIKEQSETPAEALKEAADELRQ
ncbi:ABC transporter substrate-binding protein [Halanaerobium salsuginis]|uniref:Arabinosaccharide transport system substrate-binding protein n=1 Tax=Halanaerobium salsuginis TaxID=29563 RepID=A0A1I4JZW0_9FIRM|nr:extracellular solute-binding protein [Halanaerobium salsuginis]SFL72065.1 arabinosaccharide transport system substrate-binding protein [Halanaerobium salsuginis]